MHEHHNYEHKENPYHEDYDEHHYDHKQVTHHHGPYEIKVKYDKKDHSFADDLVEEYLKNKLKEASNELGLHSKITTILPNGNAQSVSVHSSQPALSIQSNSPSVTVHHPNNHHAVTVQHPSDHHSVTVQHPADHHQVTVHNTASGVEVHHADHHVSNPATVAVHTPGHTIVHETATAVHPPAIHVATGPGVHLATAPGVHVATAPVHGPHAIHIPVHPPPVPVVPHPIPHPSPFPGAVPIPGHPLPLPGQAPNVPVPVDSLIRLLQEHAINLATSGVVGELPPPLSPAPLPGPAPIPGLPTPIAGFPNLIPGVPPPNPGLPPPPVPSVPFPIDSLLSLLQSHAINLTPKGTIGQLPHPPIPIPVDDYDDYDNDEFRGFSPEFLDDEDYFIIDSKLNDNDDQIDETEDVELDNEELRLTDSSSGNRREQFEKLKQQRKRLTALLSKQKSTLSGVLGSGGSAFASRLTKLNDRMQNLQDNLSRCNQEGSRQNLRMSNLEQSARFQKEYSEQKDEQIKQLLSTIDNLESKTHSFKEKINRFEKEIDSISNELNSKDQALANLKNREIRNFSELQNLLQNKQETIKSQIAKIDEAASKLGRMQREVRRTREIKANLRNAINTKNGEIGLLNNEKKNLVGVVKDLAKLNFNDILNGRGARNIGNNQGNNMEVLNILEKHHIDPKDILDDDGGHAEIVNQQEKAIFADLDLTTTPSPEYSTMANGEAVEDTLVSSYSHVYVNRDNGSTEGTEQADTDQEYSNSENTYNDGIE